MGDTIYKINSQGGIISSLDTEKLLFNDSTSDVVGNAYILRVNHKKPKAVTFGTLVKLPAPSSWNPCSNTCIAT